MTSVTMKYTSPSPHQILKPPMKSTKQWDVSVTKTKRWEFTSSVTPTATGWKLFQKRCNYFFLINYSPNLTKKRNLFKKVPFFVSCVQQKTKRKVQSLSALSFAFDYSAPGAPTGQTLAQAPQSMHLPGSISYLSAPAEIAPTGHSASHAPQLMQSLLIL